MKYFIHLAYKGSNYKGWQNQPNAQSIQETLETAIEKMMGKKINCIGCGRTDAGVHASQFFCHIVLERKFDFDPVFRLNKMLPDDISIYEMISVPKEVHAQHDAISRTYTYRIHFRENPFLSDVSTFYSKENLDFEKMKMAADLILKHSDFKAFCKQPDLYKNTICDVSMARVVFFGETSRLNFIITSNRFLRGMVRLLMGNILEIGYGRMSLEEFENCLKTGNPPNHYKAAYPQGLYLSSIEYPFLIRPNFSRF